MRERETHTRMQRERKKSLPICSHLVCLLLIVNANLLVSLSMYKAFTSFMNGKAPQTILTDQNMCLKEAIGMEMATTKHALCIWLIVAKFPSWFNAVLGERYNEWKAEFYRLYNLETVEDFELGWRDMVNSFGLQTNRHIASLYALRNLWALPYLRSHFFAGMTTPGHSKSINAFIQRFLSAQTRLAHFLEQVSSLCQLLTASMNVDLFSKFHIFPSSSFVTPSCSRKGNGKCIYNLTSCGQKCSSASGKGFRPCILAYVVWSGFKYKLSGCICIGGFDLMVTQKLFKI